MSCCMKNRKISKITVPIAKPRNALALAARQKTGAGAHASYQAHRRERAHAKRQLRGVLVGARSPHDLFL